MKHLFPYDAPTPQRTGSVRLLFVCTGNVCRSPLAAGLLSLSLSELDIVVRSAGTHAPRGASMPESSLRVAAMLGVNAAEHRARQLTETELESADLILALDRTHRREIVELLPRAGRSAFTLREFAHLSAALPAGSPREQQNSEPNARIRDMIAEIAHLRGMVPPPADGSSYDVVDPYGQPPAVLRESTEATVLAVRQLGAVLRQAAQPADPHDGMSS